MTDGQKEMLQFCLTRVTELDEKSAAFIRDRAKKTQYELSEKQANWLQGCRDKLNGVQKPRASNAPAQARGPNVSCPHCGKPIKVVAAGAEQQRVAGLAVSHGAQFERPSDDIDAALSGPEIPF